MSRCKAKSKQDCGCLADILKKILLLQRQDYDNENYKGCDKPYLGPICNTICYNTRPIMLLIVVLVHLGVLLIQ